MKYDDEGHTYTMEDFESICNNDDVCRAYRKIFVSILRDASQKLGPDAIAHYIMQLCLGLCYDLIAHTPEKADISRFLETAYAQLDSAPGPGDIWHRVRSKTDPNFAGYFRVSPDESGEYLQERPTGLRDEEMIDLGLDDILSGRQELIVIASFLQDVKMIPNFKDVVLLLEVLASMAYRASDPMFNVKIWRSAQIEIWRAIEVGSESPEDAYERFRHNVKRLRSSFGADGNLTSVTEAIGRLSKILDSAKPDAEPAPSVDLLMRFASWDTHETPDAYDSFPRSFLRSVAATLIILGDQMAIRELAEKLLAEGDELVERALDSDTANFIAALYDAVPPLSAAEMLFDALAGLPRWTTEPSPIILELRAALADQDKQSAARNRSVADEMLTRVTVSIHRNALDLSEEGRSRDFEKLRRAYRKGGKNSAVQLIGQLIEYEFSYPRILSGQLLKSIQPTRH